MLKFLKRLIGSSITIKKSAHKVKSNECINHSSKLNPVNDKVAVESLIATIKKGGDLDKKLLILNPVGKQAFKTLYNALYDGLFKGDTATRKSMIYACGFIDLKATTKGYQVPLLKHSERLRAALEHLSKKDKDVAIQVTALATLVRMNRTYKIKNLIALLEKPGEIKVQAELALKDLGSHAVVPLIETLKDESFPYRSSLSNLIGIIGDLNAKKPLIELLKNCDEETKRLVVDTLKKLDVNICQCQHCKVWFELTPDKRSSCCRSCQGRIYDMQITANQERVMSKIRNPYKGYK